MACMCGDLYCGSCGPAQGNAKCYQCGRWSADGGCLDPKKCQELDDAMTEQAYQDYLREEKEAAEYWQSRETP